MVLVSWKVASWFLGFLVCGFLVSRFQSLLVSWFLGFLVSKFLGFKVCWFLGFEVYWFESLLATKFQNSELYHISSLINGSLGLFLTRLLQITEL